MKFSFPVTCGCGETFPVHVSGTHLPKSADCPNCHAPIWLIEPLGNVVGMAILGRAETELKDKDWTLAIVLAAMAVECELVYLFLKWNRVDLILTRNPTDADEQEWEDQWRKWLSIALRFDKVSEFLTGQSCDSFLGTNASLLKALHTKYPASAAAASPKDFFIKELFHRRNRIVHYGEINFQQTDGEMCVFLAAILSQILAAMDAKRRSALKAKW
jgi:hypothetical protein